MKGLTNVLKVMDQFHEQSANQLAKQEPDIEEEIKVESARQSDDQEQKESSNKEEVMI